MLLGARVLPDPQLQARVGDRVILFDLQLLMGSSADFVTLTLFWFLFFGFALAPFGALMRHVERERELPRFVGLHLAALGLGGGLLLPASGFWFALLPAFNVLTGRSQS
ncbi:MAG: hypothetical protein B7733_22870 [Myxococcales bacterium FL481]|nr:MAG: hypothetical protein B7733_22870 [Myxococcales bacterium FL481]